ncbi:MAG: HAMP domain-containing sensor histidine kinase [Isosphaeraceae bacterium]
MGMSFDPQFLWLIVHDLRNPLNVLGLTLRLLEETAGRDDPSVSDDLKLMGESVAQIERMLSRLSDYSRLTTGEARPSIAPFNPGRLASEVVEVFEARDGTGGPPIRVEVGGDCPPEVELDPNRARMAIQSALTNAVASAEGGPIVVALGGGPDRLLISIRVDQPPRETVKPAVLRSNLIERLTGTALERLSLELALAAEVTEQFGGTARLDVVEGQGTTIVLDWPVQLAAVPAIDVDPGRPGLS